MKMRRVWIVKLASEPFDPPTEKVDNDKATWEQTVVAHTARRAIALAEKSVKLQSADRAQPTSKPFVISVSSRGAFDMDVIPSDPVKPTRNNRKR